MRNKMKMLSLTLSAVMLLQSMPLSTAAAEIRAISHEKAVVSELMSDVSSTEISLVTVDKLISSANVNIQEKNDKRIIIKFNGYIDDEEALDSVSRSVKAIRKEIVSNSWFEGKTDKVESEYISKIESLTPNSLGISVFKDFEGTNVKILTVSDADDIDKVVERLKTTENVEIVQEDYSFAILADEKQWGLNNSGQTVNGITGEPGVDINLPSEQNGGEILVEIIKRRLK